jgi:hypothetical protein
MVRKTHFAEDFLKCNNIQVTDAIEMSNKSQGRGSLPVAESLF